MDQRSTWDNLMWPRQCWVGLRQAEFLGLWCGTPSLDSVQRNCQVVHVGRFLLAGAAIGVLAGPFDSVLWKCPLRSRSMRRWSFAHVAFCAGGGRFQERTGMFFIHCCTPSCRYPQCRSAHRACTFTGLPHLHWRNSGQNEQPSLAAGMPQRTKLFLKSS